MSFSSLLKAIRAAEDEANRLIDGLEADQFESQDAHESWLAEADDEAEEDGRGSEPDIIDNSESINRLRECIDYLENAEREIND